MLRFLPFNFSVSRRHPTTSDPMLTATGPARSTGYGNEEATLFDMPRQHRHYRDDAAVNMALRQAPDDLPANLKTYVKSGCTSLHAMIEMSVGDYNEYQTMIRFPGRE